MSAPSVTAPAGSVWRAICAADALAEAGDGVRFEFPDGREAVPAFVVRFEGQPRAYLNQCQHVPVELDWQPGRFFDDQRLYLICATHGAHYHPGSGRCAGGPCRGKSLAALTCVEHDGRVWVAFPESSPSSASHHE